MISDELTLQCQAIVDQALAENIVHFAVGAGVLTEAGLLIVKRSEHDDMLPGLYELPGGGVDEGETIFDALHRELREETGLQTSSVVALTGTFDYVKNDGTRVRQINFLVNVHPGDVALNPDEHSEHVWICSEHDCVSLEMSEDMYQSVIKLFPYIPKGGSAHL